MAFDFSGVGTDPGTFDWGSAIAGSDATQPFGQRVDAWLGLDPKTTAGLKSALGDVSKFTGQDQKAAASGDPAMPKLPAAQAAPESKGAPPTELTQLINALMQRKAAMQVAYLSGGYPPRATAGLLGGTT